MPLQKLAFRPGVNREGTNYSNEGGYYDCDKIRFRSGNAEKIGGWTRYSNDTFLGTCRSLWNWVDLSSNNFIGVGTSKKYYIEKGGNYSDITPLLLNSSGSTTTTLTANPFLAVSGSAIITVTDTVSGLVPSKGDYVLFTSTATVGGLTISGEYTVTEVLTGISYQITAATTASSSGTGGGTVTVQYEYPIGLDNAASATGWSAGAWSPTVPVTLAANPIASAFSTLNGTINSSVTSLVLTSGTTFPNSGVIKIDNELISYTTKSVNTLSGLTRGYNGTTAAAHTTGANVGCGTYTVSYTAHGLSAGNYVSLAVSAAVDGIIADDFVSTFTIANVTTNAFTINLDGGVGDIISTSAASGGGTVVAYPQFGNRGWGAAASTGVANQLRLWSADNFGQDLVLAPRGGGVFYWEAVSGVSIRAKYLSTLSTAAGYSGAYVPTQTNQIVSSAIQRFVIAFGANSYVSGTPGTPFNPMLVRWSDQANPYQWVPQVTNQAGEFTLTNGSYIMCARATRQEILVWTDSAIYSMQYLGAPYVWGFQVLMDNISIMGPNAAVTVNNVTYWMGREKFYMYSGNVQTLNCTIRQYIFEDLNQDQGYQVFAGLNEGYNEVWWFYVSQSSGGTTVDKYVTFNYLDNVWCYGEMARTAWLETGLQPFPIATDYNNRILNHEDGVDDVAGLTPLPNNAYIQSSDFDIGDGHNFGFVWRILPDVNFNGSNVNQPHVTMTVKPRVNSGTPYGAANNPQVTSQDNFASRNVYNIQEFTGQVYTRLRGRQLAFRIESNTLGVAWQLGNPRIDIRPDGRR